MRSLACSLSALLFLLGVSSIALAQELEPNGSCPKAQDLGRLEGLIRVSGSLDAADAEPVTDVDYFRISGPPGTRVRVLVSGARSLREATFHGTLDGGCMRRTSGSGGDGSAETGIPESGVFYVATADQDDEELTGNGSGNPGAYEIAILPIVDVGSISGRVVDSETGEPRSVALLELEQCVDFGCIGTPSFFLTDENGAFVIDDGVSPGTYRLVVTDLLDARYPEQKSLRFRVDAGEQVDVGEIFLVRGDLACPAPTLR